MAEELDTSATPNKKVRNATVTVYDDIKFKSKLELYCYKLLKELNIVSEYEKHSYPILDSFQYKNEKIRGMKYTPDFVGNGWIIECKGFANDNWSIRKKLMKRYLAINNIELDFYEVRNQKEVREIVQEIKSKQDA